MATDTIRIPTTWKPLLTQLKQAVTAEQGEQILRAEIASMMPPAPQDLAKLPQSDSPSQRPRPIDDDFPPASWYTSRDRGDIPPPPFFTAEELAAYRARKSATAETHSTIAVIHPPDELPEPQPESIPAPEPVAPERVRLILRNDTLASVVIGTQRYRIDKVLDLPRAEADALAAALQAQQQGYTPNPTHIEWQP
jgi:hypothetical protein